MFQALFEAFFRVYAQVYKEKLYAVQNRDERALVIINAKLSLLHKVMSEAGNPLLYEHESISLDRALREFSVGDWH